MPTNPLAQNNIRLNLDVSSEMIELLQRLADQTGVPKSDVLRKAIFLLEVALEAKQQGKKIGIAEKDQSLTTEIVGI